MNPLYQAMTQTMAHAVPGNNMMGLLQKFNQFRSNFQGNPQQQVQALLNSGRVSPQQYQQAMQLAQQMQGLLK